MALRKHRRVLAVSPPGSGKTVIGAALIRRMKGKRVLWLAHRIELLRQARRLIEMGLPARDVGILSGPEESNVDARILVASVNMFATRPVPKVDLIVVDEAHHNAAASYRDIVDASKAMVLGLTATPLRLDGKPLGDVFSHLYEVIDSKRLAAEGFLLRPVMYGMPRKKARDLVRGATGGRGKDFSPAKLEKSLKKRPLMADVVREYERIAPGERAIVYACTRKHGKALLARFKRAGHAAAYVDNATRPWRRKELLADGGQLARGDVRVVVNVGVITEGFDCPPVGCIIVARPTKSLALWMQMCGRGARPYANKTRFVVLDHAGNAWRFGFPDDHREWSLDGSGESGEAPVKLCSTPGCGAHMHIGVRVCPACEKAQPLEERELKERQVELEKLRRSEEERARWEQVVRNLAKERKLGDKWIAAALKEVA